MRRRGREDAGQSTVELALVLPFVFMLLMLLVQAGLVVRDRVLVTHASREAVRTAAVTGDSRLVESSARRSAKLDPSHLDVEVLDRGEPGGTVTVRVSYASPTRIPGLAALWPSTELESEATMRVER